MSAHQIRISTINVPSVISETKMYEKLEEPINRTGTENKTKPGLDGALNEGNIL